MRKGAPEGAPFSDLADERLGDEPNRRAVVEHAQVSLLGGEEAELPETEEPDPAFVGIEPLAVLFHGHFPFKNENEEKCVYTPYGMHARWKSFLNLSIHPR